MKPKLNWKKSYRKISYFLSIFSDLIKTLVEDDIDKVVDLVETVNSANIKTLRYRCDKK